MKNFRGKSYFANKAESIFKDIPEKAFITGSCTTKSTLGKTTVERDWAVGKLKSLDFLNKKGLVESKVKHLSKARQCALLSINRSLIYYTSGLKNNCKSYILNKIDSIYSQHPEYGHPYIYKQLLEDGFQVGRDWVLKYMRILVVHPLLSKL